MSFEEARTRLEISAGRMSRLESGVTAPDVWLAKSLLDLYGVPVNDWEPVLDQVRSARKSGWWREFGLSTRGYIPLETAATLARKFELVYIPGLLQTADYARAGFRAMSGESAEWIENAVNVRMFRQRRLTEVDPIKVVAVIDELVLTRPVGSAALMAGQLRHRVDVSSLANVTLQVVPFGARPHIGYDGAFTILSFADHEDVAFVEIVADKIVLDKEEQVHNCHKAFDRLQALALGPEESRALITRYAERLDGGSWIFGEEMSGS